ncbi:uroporphyrinogen-III synthase [Fodinicola acaciae]|uniref:uroporphyrinogen-III synthase n=1 Tax=Fodinicola acaciae TaxID=2681555 RepID=UPI0013D1FD4C|nr:uroporphyrinogen-III synthase [Fodinicola acaciae]
MSGELAGRRVVVTAERRRETLADMLERHGAIVSFTPTIHTTSSADDPELRSATDACVRPGVDDLVVMTGVGFRGWLDAATSWNSRDDLVAALRSVRILARGPKAVGAVRGTGLRESYAAASESSDELLTHLLAEPLTGRRVAVQLHGDRMPAFVTALRDAGAYVIEVPVYQWHPPTDPQAVNALVDAIVAGELDIVTFTSAPAAANLLAAAGERRDDVVKAFHGPVVAGCVGPVTAAPLTALGVPTVQPERGRLGALVRALEEHFR